MSFLDSFRRQRPDGPALQSGLVGLPRRDGVAEAPRLRLVGSCDILPEPVPETVMPRQFTAIVLLDRYWELDIPAIAATTGVRFPSIGRMDAVIPASAGTPGAIEIEGARVTLACMPAPLERQALMPPMKAIRVWDPEPAIRRHVSAIRISCSSELAGLEGAEALAAAVHFVATATCTVAPACAVFWREGFTLTEPLAFCSGGDMILGGRMPLGAWASFAAIVAKGYEPEDATGMVTYGLRPFLGRELELAPRPRDARAAYRCISQVARMALDRGIQLVDGQRLTDPDGAFDVIVRERNFWLRRDMSVFVLVGRDAVVDAETLKPRAQPAA